MSEFSRRVQDYVRDAVADREYHELLDWSTIERAENTGEVTVTSTVQLEELPSSESDRLQPDLAAALNSDPYEEITLPLTGSLADEAGSYLDRVRSAASVKCDGAGESTTRNPILRCRYSEGGAVASQYFTIDVPTLPYDFSPLAEDIIREDRSLVDDPERIVFVSVHAPLSDPTKSDQPSNLSPDYTIHFTTDTPHELWADCETLEEYAEMVAKNSKDTTTDEVLGWETYTNHFHLTGDVSPNERVATYTQQALDTHLTITDGAFSPSVEEFGMRREDDEKLWVRGRVQAHIADL